MAGQPCTFCVSVHGKDRLIKVQVPGPNPLYRIFSWGRNCRNNRQSWRCQGCRSIQGNDPNVQVPLIKILVEEIAGRPERQYFFDHDPNVPLRNRVHVCEPLTEEEATAQNMTRNLKRKMATSGHSCLREYENMHENMLIDHGLEHSLQIEPLLPAFSEVKSGLYRWKSSGIPVIRQFADIPLSMQVTLGDRNNPHVPLEQAPRYIIDMHEEMRIPIAPHLWRRTIIFGSRLDLEILRNSTHVICDGTFNYCPKSFGQLYSILGFHHGEAHVCVVALLPGKTEEAYVAFFDTVLAAVLEEFGDLGNLEHAAVNFDFEWGAQNAWRRVLPLSTIRGCVFHFKQANWRNIQDIGLSTAYRTIPAVEEYCNMLTSLCMYPPWLVRWAFNNVIVPGFTRTHTFISSDIGWQTMTEFTRGTTGRITDPGRTITPRACIVRWIVASTTKFT